MDQMMPLVVGLPLFVLLIAFGYHVAAVLVVIIYAFTNRD